MMTWRKTKETELNASMSAYLGFWLEKNAFVLIVFDILVPISLSSITAVFNKTLFVQ